MGGGGNKRKKEKEKERQKDAAREANGDFLGFRFSSYVRSDQPQNSLVVRRIGATGEFVKDYGSDKRAVRRGVSVRPEVLREAFIVQNFQFILRPESFYASAAATAAGEERSTLVAQGLVDDFPPDSRQHQALSNALATFEAKIHWRHIVAVSTRLDVDDIQCPICLESPTCPRVTPCGHVFCFHCILRSMNAQRQLGVGYNGNANSGGGGGGGAAAVSAPGAGAGGPIGSGQEHGARPRTCPLCAALIDLQGLRPCFIDPMEPLTEASAKAQPMQTFTLAARSQESSVLLPAGGVVGDTANADAAVEEDADPSPPLVSALLQSHCHFIPTYGTPSARFSRYAFATPALLRSLYETEITDIARHIDQLGEDRPDPTAPLSEGDVYEQNALKGVYTHLTHYGYSTISTVNCENPSVLQQRLHAQRGGARCVNLSAKAPGGGGGVGTAVGTANGSFSASASFALSASAASYSPQKGGKPPASASAAAGGPSPSHSTSSQQRPGSDLVAAFAPSLSGGCGWAGSGGGGFATASASSRYSSPTTSTGPGFTLQNNIHTMAKGMGCRIGGECDGGGGTNTNADEHCGVASAAAVSGGVSGGKQRISAIAVANSPAESPIVWTYRLADGQTALLHPLNVRMLLKHAELLADADALAAAAAACEDSSPADYDGSLAAVARATLPLSAAVKDAALAAFARRLPSSITARVLDAEVVTQQALGRTASGALKRPPRGYGHIPPHAAFLEVFVDLTPIVSRAVLVAFKRQLMEKTSDIERKRRGRAAGDNDGSSSNKAAAAPPPRGSPPPATKAAKGMSPTAAAFFPGGSAPPTASVDANGQAVASALTPAELQALHRSDPYGDDGDGEEEEEQWYGEEEEEGEGWEEGDDDGCDFDGEGAYRDDDHFTDEDYAAIVAAVEEADRKDAAAVAAKAKAKDTSAAAKAPPSAEPEEDCGYGDAYDDYDEDDDDYYYRDDGDEDACAGFRGNRHRGLVARSIADSNLNRQPQQQPTPSGGSPTAPNNTNNSALPPREIVKIKGRSKKPPSVVPFTAHDPLAAPSSAGLRKRVTAVAAAASTTLSKAEAAEAAANTGKKRQKKEAKGSFAAAAAAVASTSAAAVTVSDSGSAPTAAAVPPATPAVNEGEEDTLAMLLAAMGGDLTEEEQMWLLQERAIAESAAAARSSGGGAGTAVFDTPALGEQWGGGGGSDNASFTSSVAAAIAASLAPPSAASAASVGGHTNSWAAKPRHFDAEAFPELGGAAPSAPPAAATSGAQPAASGGWGPKGAASAAPSRPQPHPQQAPASGKGAAGGKTGNGGGWTTVTSQPPRRSWRDDAGDDLDSYFPSPAGAGGAGPPAAPAGAWGAKKK